MKTANRDLSALGRSIAAGLLALFLGVGRAGAETLNAVWNSATDVPLTSVGYTATGTAVNLVLDFAPDTGTQLTVVNNTWPGFINGTFSNLTNGQAVALSYGGILYNFVANYYGGTGNDLVLAWARNRPFAWGNNSTGQLGDGTQMQRQVPVPVNATGVLAGKTVVALAAGDAFSLALCSDGTLASWGDNSYGQLGDNTTNSHNVPVLVNTMAGVSALASKRVVGISAGRQHSLALCSDGTVAAWGHNNYGQLGDATILNRLAPSAVNTASGSALHGETVVAVAAGYYHSLAVCWDGTMAAWGRNAEGQLGNNGGGYVGAQQNSPVAVNEYPSFSALAGKMVIGAAGGFSHSLAWCSDGTLAAWGQNYFGQLGNRTGNPSLVPVAVDTSYSDLEGRTVSGISVGCYHSLALCSDGTVAAWGQGMYGQRGDGTTANYPVPTAVSTAWDVSALYGEMPIGVAAGCNHGLAVCADGTVASWGANNYGQLGDNTINQSLVPVAVARTPLATGERFCWVASSSAANHSLALVAEPPGPPGPPIRLTNPKSLANGSFQFAFTNTPGAPSTVMASTNIALPLSQWTPLTGLTEVSPGQFQFTDPEASSTPRRFYTLRSP